MATSPTLAPVDLDSIKWKGEDAFRSLSYYFTMRWNTERLGRYVRHVLGVFAVPPDPMELRSPPTPGLPPIYSLVDLGGKQERRYHVYHGTDPLIMSDKLDDPLNLLFWHVNNETFLQSGDFLLIHAGAVVTPGGDGLLLPGQAGSGKTTLTAGLVRREYGYLSDEGGAIDPVTRRLYPYPKTLNLKAGSHQLFPELRARNGKPTMVMGRWLVRPDEIRPGAVGSPCELRFLIAPRFEEGIETRIIPMTPAEALAEVWPSVWSLHRYGGRALHLLSEVFRRSHSYRLVFGNLDKGVEAVNRLTLSRV